MNSSGRIIRSTAPLDDVFVLSGGACQAVPATGTLATAAAIVAAAEGRAQELIVAAEARAAAIVALAERQADEVRAESVSEGHALGRAAVEAEAAACLDVIRRAAAEGKAVRDGIAAQSSAIVARAVSLATRRIVAGYYDAGPERTEAAVQDALRAASGQDILAIRVHPSLGDTVSASLGSSGSYVRPDDSVAIGGCIIDLAMGTLDASLDARFSMLDLALAEAGGEFAQ